MDKALLQHLSGFITENRKQTFEAVLANRTRYVSVVVEDIYQPHNASAVLRSCDCFGVQDVHILEYENEYTVNPGVALGASKWLDLEVYRDEHPAATCFDKLREKGFRIMATTPHTDDMLIDEIPLDQPVALVFGNEGRGISDTVRALADGFVKIPMYGFTESFNISVSAALSLYAVTEKLRNTNINWQLSEAEKDELRLRWTRATIKNVEGIEARYREAHGSGD